MQSVFDAWRDQVLAHERDAAALRGGEHGHGHGGFTYANRPLDIHRADDPVLNSERLGQADQLPAQVLSDVSSVFDQLLLQQPNCQVVAAIDTR